MHESKMGSTKLVSVPEEELNALRVMVAGHSQEMKYARQVICALIRLYGQRDGAQSIANVPDDELIRPAIFEIEKDRPNSRMIIRTEV